MWFININAENRIVGLFDGSKDYVHAVTGEDHPERIAVPDGAIQVSKSVYDTIYNARVYPIYKWENDELVLDVPAEAKNYLIEDIVSREVKAFVDTRNLELAALDVDTLADMVRGL